MKVIPIVNDSGRGWRIYPHDGPCPHYIAKLWPNAGGGPFYVWDSSQGLISEPTAAAFREAFGFLMYNDFLDDPPTDENVVGLRDGMEI